MTAPAKAAPAGRGLVLAIIVALAVAAADQALKLWLLFGFNLASRGVVSVMPSFDLALAWNTGISYGLFQSDTLFGLVVLTGFKIVAALVLAVWLVRAPGSLTRLGLALIIGGAVGNAIDRLLHGAVVDYALLYAWFGGQRYDWYIFNLADVAIVAGVAGLLYEMLVGENAAKVPRSPSK